jgi:hypothetical protein
LDSPILDKTADDPFWTGRSLSQKRSGSTLVVLIATAFGPERLACQEARSNSRVPDESVVQQWSEVFGVVLREVQHNFTGLASHPADQSQSLTDRQLINGTETQRPDVPKLQGASDCKIEKDDDGKSSYTVYRCFFPLSGTSSQEAADLYLRLVRLVEKAAGGTAENIFPPFVSKSFESRAVRLNIPNSPFHPSVKENWVEHGGAEVSNFLTVSVAGTRLPSSKGTPGIGDGGEIDGVIASGHYTQMPSAQLVGSSGSGPASIKITNDTAYDLSVFYEGTTSKTVTVAAGQTTAMELQPGSYRELGRVKAPNVLPFVGQGVFGPGDNFVVHFYIAAK